MNKDMLLIAKLKIIDEHRSKNLLSTHKI